VFTAHRMSRCADKATNTRFDDHNFGFLVLNNIGRRIKGSFDLGDSFSRKKRVVGAV
jgi:hypothetical protein